MHASEERGISFHCRPGRLSLVPGFHKMARTDASVGSGTVLLVRVSYAGPSSMLRRVLVEARSGGISAIPLVAPCSVFVWCIALCCHYSLTTSAKQSTMSTSRAGRKAALAKFRDAKRRRDQGEEDDLFEGNMKEEEDVYDIVDETEYQSLVNSRRQREDFVVDDGE
jgi:hypothetical protein